MRIDHELQRLLIREVCALVNGCTRTQAAAQLRLNLPRITLLRAGTPRQFSVARLLRIFAEQGYDVEVHLRAMPDRFRLGARRCVSVTRYDRYGRPLSSQLPSP